MSDLATITTVTPEAMASEMHHGQQGTFQRPWWQGGEHVSYGYFNAPAVVEDTAFRSGSRLQMVLVAVVPDDCAINLAQEQRSS